MRLKQLGLILIALVKRLTLNHKIEMAKLKYNSLNKKFIKVWINIKEER